MEKFLQKLADDLYGTYGGNISNICVVTPSRRAGLFFKKYLSEKINAPVWAPEILAIQDFVSKVSPLPVSDKLTLIFELYEVYKEFSDESFDRFYPWGDMLLNDFDEIDKNLVEADYLFKILYEHREIEKDFEFKVSDIENFYNFWQSFSNRELTDVQKSFLETWEVMGKVYHKFRKSLLDKKICYEGMAYRRIYEMIRTGGVNFEWEKIIFAGFNYLNNAEQGIINELLKKGIAETYWDADEYYMNNEIQEAGNFIRRNFVNLNVSGKKWISNEFTGGTKNIKIIGASLEVSQGKALGNELKHVGKQDLDNTAVVLPDESLMLSVLHSLPGNVETVNVTMGFPFKESGFYSLLLLLKNLQKNKKGKDNSTVFYHKDVLQLLMHPYIKWAAPYDIYNFIENIKKRNIIYVSVKKIHEAFDKIPEIINEIFKGVVTSQESLEYIYRIIEILGKQKENDSAYKKFEMEYLYKFYKELNHLSSIINSHSLEFESETFWKLLIEITVSIKIPFSGEPLRGLQVMGLLETRQLDFENVFILSMNEGILPRGNTHSSFIPYNLRKAFKLPTFEDEDRISAYYFYRLLQKAKNICLIYNTETGTLSTGEKSRYIMQLENELAVLNKRIKFEKLVLHTDTDIPKRMEISINKSDKILETLRSKERFSATTIAGYINCPLQFYFKTIAGLKEEESVEEFFSGGGFGSILHQIMDQLYSNYTDKTVDEEAITALLYKINNNYDEVWSNACEKIPEYAEFKKEVHGKNILYKNIIKKLVSKILENDLKETPFKVVSVEREVRKEIHIDINNKIVNVPLFGRLDRIEDKNGVLRIIDYKTGSVDIQKVKKELNNEDFELIFKDPAYKEKFQQYFYSSIYIAENPGKKINVGIYPLKNISGGAVFFDEGYIPEEKLELFNRLLNKLLVKIFDSQTPFSQTDDLERCKYCPYISICHRD